MPSGAGKASASTAAPDERDEESPDHRPPDVPDTAQHGYNDGCEGALQLFNGRLHGFEGARVDARQGRILQLNARTPEDLLKHLGFAVGNAGHPGILVRDIIGVRLANGMPEPGPVVHDVVPHGVRPSANACL